MSAMKNRLVLPLRTSISSEEYHKHPAAGSSNLKKILRSPAHYKYDVDRLSKQTAAQEFGQWIHLAVLEPEVFKERAVIWPQFAGKGSKAMTETWRQEQEGKIILKLEEMEIIEGIRNSIERHETARRLLVNGNVEESFFWQDAQTGLVCKCRPDSWKEGLLVDLKTTVNAGPQEFPKVIANMGYHLQAAYYLDGVSAVLGEEFKKFAILAVEKEPPYAVATYVLDDATLEVGRMLYRRALRILRDCKLRNHYPGYPDYPVPISLPTWAWPLETEERESRAGYAFPEAADLDLGAQN
jgi:hypothetical protein